MTSLWTKFSQKTRQNIKNFYMNNSIVKFLTNNIVYVKTNSTIRNIVINLRFSLRRCIGKPAENNTLRLTLSKCEFIGAEVTVEKSTSTSMVGLSGIIVRETQRLFEIINKKSEYKSNSWCFCCKQTILVCSFFAEIPKRSTVLSFTVGPMQCTVIGKHFMTRPAERSVKKIKSLMFADI